MGEVTIMIKSKSTDVLAKPRAPGCMESQHHILTGESNISMEELKRYSRAILCCIVYGNNSAGENGLLREIYWHTLEALARLERDKRSALDGFSDPYALIPPI